MIIRKIKLIDDIFTCIELVKKDTLVLVLEEDFLVESQYRLRRSLTRSQDLRADKYCLIGDKLNHIATHAVVNIIFSGRYGRFPTDDDIGFDNGKPYFYGHCDFNYSISHTRSCSVIAFSNRPIGIDIEDYSKSFNYSSILKNYFIYELEKFKNIDTRAFYTLWTVKEACLKFYARGIRDLQSINIVGINNEAARAVSLIEKQVMDVSITYFDDRFVISTCFEN